MSAHSDELLIEDSAASMLTYNEAVAQLFIAAERSPVTQRVMYGHYVLLSVLYRSHILGHLDERRYLPRPQRNFHTDVVVLWSAETTSGDWSWGLFSVCINRCPTRLRSPSLRLDPTVMVTFMYMLITGLFVFFFDTHVLAD